MDSSGITVAVSDAGLVWLSGATNISCKKLVTFEKDRNANPDGFYNEETLKKDVAFLSDIAWKIY